ncbi:hypothetical protein Scep_016213 [Stephania cephalantha]|uniref:Uncharacterized protein n=1 Tax=Stephania cephalantha TaxID=152367 RepID=A0AAP0NUF4_9MAGN
MGAEEGRSFEGNFTPRGEGTMLQLPIVGCRRSLSREVMSDCGKVVVVVVLVGLFVTV